MLADGKHRSTASNTFFQPLQPGHGKVNGGRALCYPGHLSTRRHMVGGVLQRMGCETSRPRNLRPHDSAVRHVSHPCALSLPLESDTQRWLRDR